MDEKPPVSLPEEDYLKVIDIIRRLYRCETRAALKDLIGEKFFPLFNIQGLGASWTEFDLNLHSQKQGQRIFHMGITEKEADIWQAVFPYQKEVTQKFITSMQTVLATGVDLPRDNVQSVLNDFLADHPQYNRAEIWSFNAARGLMALSDPPDFNIGIGFQRFDPHEEPFTLREVRMAELIRPSLILALKFIAINEELKTFHSLVDTLSDSLTPMALTNIRGLILFCNSAFQNIMSRKKGDFLPEELTALLKQKEEAFAGSENPESPIDSLAFFKFPGGDVRCSWTRLSRPGTSEDGCWLLKMKPVADPYSQTLLAMQQADLTPREIEVATRVCDGFDDSEIAQRLFISPQTVKNHLNSIYKKLDVHSRTQLLARLRPSPEEGEV